MGNWKAPLTHHMDLGAITPKVERARKQQERTYRVRIIKPKKVQDCHDEVCRLFAKHGTRNAAISEVQGMDAMRSEERKKVDLQTRIDSMSLEEVQAARCKGFRAAINPELLDREMELRGHKK